MKQIFNKFKSNIYLFFNDPVGRLALPPELKKNLYDMNFKMLTPIQKKTLPHGIKGKDIIGQAQTGTGKTAAYLTIIYSTLMKKKRDKKSPGALILAPTRELVVQIYRESCQIGKDLGLKNCSVYGGDNFYRQSEELASNPDIIIATPGRLLAFIREGQINFSRTDLFVVDEADRMLDMGFMPDVKRIESALPDKNNRQTLFFSATLPVKVTEFAYRWTRKAVEVRIEPEQVTSENVYQKAFLVKSDEKLPLLLNIIKQKQKSTIIVFTNQKAIAKRLYFQLLRFDLNCRLLTGDIDQKKRQRALDEFSKGDSKILIATDVAARGLHIDGVSHVINYDIPNKPENYIHRIGRTGRAGHKGKAINFASPEDSFYIPAIEEYSKETLKCEYPPEEWLVMPELPKKRKKKLPQRNKPAVNNKLGPKKKLPPHKKSVSAEAKEVKPVKKMPKTVYKDGKFQRVDV